MAQNDTYVQKQIQHMMAFIEQEANEKADEIDSKAEEEFNIQKGQLVQEARSKITEEFERKEKQVELQRKIQASKMSNAARIEVLKNREDHIKNVLEETRRQLGTITQNQQAYSQLMEKLLLQGLLQLCEKDVGIRCRQADVALVDSIKDKVVGEYSKATKQTVNILLDKNTFLQDKTLGGVELFANKGKIKVANTLEKRLEHVALQMMPSIRTKLFGSNPRRRFLD